MTYREVARVHFPNLAPTLVADRTVIALTPATPDRGWAAETTWLVSRSLARSGRRVVLIDLDLEHPALAAGAPHPADEGVVDAFVFGVSLTHVAREQDPELFFIGVGTTPLNPAEVWSNPRWQRLARGFKNQGAAMLLFVPAAALPQLGCAPDGLVVLAPAGHDPESGTIPGITEVMRRGVPLLAVVREGLPPRPSRPSVPLRASRPIRPPPRSRRSVYGILGAVVLALGVAGWWLRESLPFPLPAAPRAAERPPVAATSPPRPGARGLPADSLFYSVQVAAFNTMSQAMVVAADLEGAGEVATVTPIRLGGQAIWYRVLVGALPTAGAADSLLRRLWDRGLVERPNGTILRTPHAYQLPGDGLAGMRARGVPAYIVDAPDGTHMLAGAFEAPDQATVADSLLRAAGVRGTLIQRTGIRP